MADIHWTRRDALIGGALVSGAVVSSALAAPASAQNGGDAVDRIVTDFMRAFATPGIAIALVRPGEPVLARGYGVRRLGQPEPVTADTLFGIASNTKAFVAAALAMLVEEGRVGWDEPVTRYLPEFATSDPVVTRLMTVRDLLCHRSGLPLGAGDLMQFPRSDHSRAEIVRGLRFLPFARGFRSGYAYDNILYIVAGVLIERVAGMPYEQFMTARLLRPLGIARAVASRELLATADVAGRHGRVGPPARGVGPLQVIEPDESPTIGPAGGIHASAAEILSWLQTQLARGTTPAGRHLWSEASAIQMWTPQVITASTQGPTAADPARPVIKGYALGWGVSDHRGRRLLSHQGGLSGQVTQVALLPDHGIGVAVFTNVEDHFSVQLRQALLDHALGLPAFDWLASARTLAAADDATLRAAVGSGDFAAPTGGLSLPLQAYAGRYRDPWYGDIVVREVGGALAIDFTRTAVFKSRLERFGPDTFRTRFAPGNEDAVVAFVVEGGRAVRLRLHALSPLADFSYDFHDLAPVRVA